MRIWRCLYHIIYSSELLILAFTTGYVPSKKMICDLSPCGAVEDTRKREKSLNFYFVFTSIRNAMERQRCFVCLKLVSSSSCTQTLRMSRWETWENWRKIKLTMTELELTMFLTTRMMIYLSSPTNTTSHMKETMKTLLLLLLLLLLLPKVIC